MDIHSGLFLRTADPLLPILHFTEGIWIYWLSVLSKLGFSPQSRKERQEVIFLFVPVQPEQIKSLFLRQKKPLLHPESGRTQSESIPEGLSLVIQSRQRRDWITKENISPRSLRLSGEPGFERDE